MTLDIDRVTMPGAPDLGGCGPLSAPAGPDLRPLRQQIFERIRAEGRCARAEISRALGISPGSVTQLTADLIGAGLLREVEGLPRDSGRGRPPVALEVVPEAHFVIGMKLAETRHHGVLCDLAGNVRAEATVDSADRRKPAAILVDEAEALVQALLETAGVDANRVSGIGVGLPGIVDFDNRKVRWSPLLAQTDLPFAGLMQDRLGCPVLVDNDANLFTLAEQWFGLGRTISYFAVVTIEQGVGMGLVLNSRLFRGGTGLGMELGHTKVQLDGALCRCGQRGCLEAYLADYALAREAATALDRPPDAAFSAESLLRTLNQQAREGHQAAQAIFRRAGRYLALGLANVIQLFDPSLIILSGERMEYDFMFTQDVMAQMSGQTLGRGRSQTRVEIHAWGSPVWARGGAALALTALSDALLVDGWAA